MATRTQIKRRGRLSLILGTLLAAVAFAAVAYADDINITNDLVLDTASETKAPGTTGSLNVYLEVAEPDSQNGCNATGSAPMVVSVTSSDVSKVTINSPGTVTLMGCGTGAAVSIGYAVASGASTGGVVVTAAYSSGGRGQPNATNNPDTYTVNVSPSNTPPTVSVTAVTDGASYEFGAVPAAGCSVVDAEDGNSSFAASLSAISGPKSAHGLGSQTASCSYTDAGGLSDSDSATYSIVDTTAPQIALLSRTPANGNGWNNTDVTLVWTCADTGSSGVVSAMITKTVSSEGAGQSESATCEDHGGNTASDTQTGINIDKTAPTVVYTSSSPAPNGAGWNNTDVVATFTASDSLSGFAGPLPTQTGTSTTSGQGAAVMVGSPAFTDLAGNTVAAGTAMSDAFMIDKTPPTNSVTGVTHGATYVLGSAPTAGCDTQDGLSGVKTSATLSVSGGPVGSITATCSGGSDNADNAAAAASATYTVVYAYSGFFRPIDNLPAYNVVKAGQAVPVKFSLAGNQGLNILASGYPKWKQVACDPTAPEEGVEETSTAGNSSLSYDAIADQYVYVWKTEKSWAGKCMSLEVKLNDTTSHYANFKFTK